MKFCSFLKSTALVTGICIPMLMGGTAHAQDEKGTMIHRGASQDEIKVRLRSIRRPADPGKSSTDTASRVLDFRIYFEYDSAELTSDAKAELRNYGKSLADPEFKDVRWALEGHTDASGSAAYNEDLSERRAKSVYRYLIQEYGVGSGRLVPIGKGENELYDPTNPLSAKNRRVRIRYLGG